MRKTKNLQETYPIHERFKQELKKHLPPAEVEQFLEACRKPLNRSITINLSKISIEEFKNITSSRWRTLTETQFTPGNATFYVDREDRDIALGRTFLHEAGYMYIQEVAAASSAPQLDLQPGDLVLDMASAPGGKATQLASMLLTANSPLDKKGLGGIWNPWLVIANDVAWPRLKQLTHNLNRCGAWNTWVTKFNGFSFGKNLPNFFEHVLLDAPCSGEGTAFKSDFALKHWKIEEINKIAGTQFQLLISAIKCTKPGGTIMYSTCTINPYENEHIIQKAKDFFAGDIEIEQIHTTNTRSGLEWSTTDIDTTKFARLWPHEQGTWGFFLAKIRKLNATDVQYTQPHKLSPRNQFTLTMSKKLQSEANAWIQKNFWFVLDPDRHLVAATKEKVYLTSPKFADIQKHINLEKIGIPILKRDRLFGFRPTHYLGALLWEHAIRHTMELTDEQAQRYSWWKNLDLNELLLTHKQKPVSLDTTQKDYLLTRRGKWFSRTKLVKGEWKNKFGK